MDIHKAGILLKSIWDRAAIGKYVCLGWIDGENAHIPSERKWNQTMIKWRKFDGVPPLLKDFLEEHQGDELYFSPLAYTEPARRASTVAPHQSFLFADLDRVSEEVIRRSVSIWLRWETSPGNSQALWAVQVGLTPADYDLGGLNHRLTHHLGADRSGWDITQMLRVPMSDHHKQKPPHQGRLLERDPSNVVPRYVFEDVLPKVTVPTGPEGAKGKPVAWSKLPIKDCLKQLDAGLRHRLMDEDAIAAIKQHQNNRSEARYTLEKDMLKKGIEPGVVAKLVRNSPWGDDVNPNTILSEVAKAAAERARMAATTKALAKEAIKESKQTDSWQKMVGIKPETLEKFWARESLMNIRQLAASRLVSPWALLGVAMARAVASVPPYVVLPPIVGGEGSLNLFVALTAQSGGGKSAAVAVGSKAVGENFHTHTAGTGEGLIQHYLRQEKDKETGETRQVLIAKPQMFLTVDEIDMLANVSSRSGQTTLETLRSAWSGTMLANGNASLERRRKVDPHTYRMALVAGVQPGRADVLINRAAINSGTLQRFLWMPAGWREWPGSEVEAPEVEALEIDSSMWSGDIVGGFAHVGVEDWLRDIVDEDFKRRMVSDTPQAAFVDDDNLDSHAMLSRLKVAAALMILDGRKTIRRDDWSRAGVVMRVSDATRNWVFQVASEQQREELRDRGLAQRTMKAEEKKSDEEINADRVARYVQGRGEVEWSRARRRTLSASPTELELALPSLKEIHGIEVITRGRARFLVARN